MGNYYDPEHHDIWGDSEDDQWYQNAPRAAICSRSINAAYNDDDMPSPDEKQDTSFTDTNYASPVQTAHMPRHDTISNSLVKTKPPDTVANNADSMNPKQAAQLLMYHTALNNFEAAPPVIESNYYTNQYYAEGMQRPGRRPLTICRC